MDQSERLTQIVECLDVRVENDNDGTNRLFLETIFTNSLEMSEAQYLKMEKEINEFEIVGKGFTVYAGNDVSGYDYWTVRQQEDNYIQITINIATRGQVDIKALNRAISRAQNRFAKYSRF